MILGIDFGTCFSSVAFMNGLIPVTDYIKDPNKTGIPTLFMYSSNSQKELYGYDCTTAEAIINSSDVVRYIKRTIRENPGNLNETVTSGGMNFTYNEIIKKYLMYLIAQAKTAAIQSGEFSNCDIEGITVTAPVGIADGQMTATDYNELLINTVMEITGLPKKNVTILQEPVAAAISFLYSEDLKKKYSEKQTVLVFDLGGGTLDVSIVEHDPATMAYNIKAKEGDLTLGGNEWDTALKEAVLSKIGLSDDFESQEERDKFNTSIIRLKHELTDVDDTMIVFKYNGSSKFCDFSRSEFESATKGLLDRAIEITKTASSSCGISSIDKIVLVGGSCNMPQIRQRMLEEFPELGESRIVTHDPSKAIAKGAAVYTKMEHSSEGEETKDTLINIATHTYGFEIEGPDSRDMIYNLLFKGTPFGNDSTITVHSEVAFVAVRNNQTRITFTVYESNAAKGQGNNANWMQLGSGEKKNGMKVTVQIPPEYLGRADKYSCKVTFELDRNEVLTLIVTDSTGKRVGYDKKQI